jgi:hypothetical protein
MAVVFVDSAPAGPIRLKNRIRAIVSAMAPGFHFLFVGLCGPQADAAGSLAGHAWHFKGPGFASLDRDRYLSATLALWAGYRSREIYRLCGHRILLGFMVIRCIP